MILSFPQLRIAHEKNEVRLILGCGLQPLVATWPANWERASLASKNPDWLTAKVRIVRFLWKLPGPYIKKNAALLNIKTQTKRNSKYSMRTQKRAKPRQKHTLRSEQQCRPSQRRDRRRHCVSKARDSTKRCLNNGDFQTVSGMNMKLNYKT